MKGAPIVPLIPATTAESDENHNAEEHQWQKACHGPAAKPKDDSYGYY